MESTYKTVVNNGPKVLKNPRDYDAWAEVMWGGTLAHNNLMNTGREMDWASHNIEHELSGIYDIAHGAGLSIVFPAWMQYVYKHDVARFAQFATRIWNVDYDFANPEWTALEGIRAYKDYMRSIGAPVSLKELGIGDDRLMEMADKATNGDKQPQGGFVKLKKKDIYEILKLAL